MIRGYYRGEAVKVGDMVHLLLPPGESRDRGRNHSTAYLSRNSGQKAVGIIVDTLENADGFWNYEVLVENEKMWFPDLQLRVVNEKD